MTTKMLGYFLVFLAGAAAAGCGSATSTAPAADGAAASADADAAASDTASSDTASSDSASQDTAAPDADASGSDTLTVDTQALDAQGNDSVSSDSSLPDSADAADAAADSEADAAGDTLVADVPSAVVTGNLVEAGWSFGECMKGCKGSMTLQGASLILTISDIDGTVSHMAKGILTTGAAAELEKQLSPLTGKALPNVFGCPDCADGGASYVVFSDGTATSKHTYEYGKPPAELAGLDKLVAASLAGLKNCKGDETVVVQGVCPMDLP